MKTGTKTCNVILFQMDASDQNSNRPVIYVYGNPSRTEEQAMLELSALEEEVQAKTAKYGSTTICINPSEREVSIAEGPCS